MVIMTSKTKYNFDKEKLDFFKSNFKEVKAYFEHKYNIYNRHIAWKTKGWTIEKKIFIKNNLKQAQTELENESKNKWKQELRNIENARIKIIHELTSRISSKTPTNELINIVKLFNELHEPIKNNESKLLLWLPPSPFMDWSLTWHNFNK